MARHVSSESSRDVIVAPATPPGIGAVAIVRVSGAGSHSMASAMLKTDMTGWEMGQLRLAGIADPRSKERIDTGLVCLWRAPRSYTGEDMVEFHCHGSPAVVGAVMDACIACGARPAQPGEFTQRSYLNGKLDLAQAEAVASLTSSQTAASRRAALAQLSGGLSRLLLELRGRLVQVTAELEASIDYPDEGIPDVEQARLQRALKEAHRDLSELLGTAERGKRLREGARVVFAGPPNAGKSSLFNAILRRERAIVTPHPGTTRDTLEAVVDLAGIPMTLIDTAGLRASAEEIEAIGIRRTREEIESADLVLFVVDASLDLGEAMVELDTIRTLPHLLLLNKADLLGDRPVPEVRETAIVVSARDKQSIDELEREILDRLSCGQSEGGSPTMVMSARHEKALRRAAEGLADAARGFDANLSPEFIVVDLQSALSEIDEILGRRELDEDILDAIFSTFCLGK